MVDQIRFKTLIQEDEVYKRWLLRLPRIQVVHSNPPWRFYAQYERGGMWRRLDTDSYPKALGAVKLKLQDAWDMTIHCKPQGFHPPIVKVNGVRQYSPLPPGHKWCCYCRRPTVFAYFLRHPNIKPTLNNEEVRKCTICGARETGMKQYPRSPLRWPIDLK